MRELMAFERAMKVADCPCGRLGLGDWMMCRAEGWKGACMHWLGGGRLLSMDRKCVSKGLQRPFRAHAVRVLKFAVVSPFSPRLLHFFLQGLFAPAG